MQPGITTILVERARWRLVAEHGAAHGLVPSYMFDSGAYSRLLHTVTRPRLLSNCA